MPTGKPSPGFARNPGKQLTIEPYTGTVTVEAGGRVIARTERALKLTEPPYPGVFYIPFADIAQGEIQKTTHSTHCPYKGDASYWSVAAAGPRGTNSVWAYEAPYDETAAIAGHAAFYPDRFTITAD